MSTAQGTCLLVYRKLGVRRHVQYHILIRMELAKQSERDINLMKAQVASAQSKPFPELREHLIDRCLMNYTISSLGLLRPGPLTGTLACIGVHLAFSVRDRVRAAVLDCLIMKSEQPCVGEPHATQRLL
jgi:hypothetical protein